MLVIFLVLKSISPYRKGLLNRTVYVAVENFS